MADETDGVGETFDDSLRIALTVASQFGERISRLREQLPVSGRRRPGRRHARCKHASTPNAAPSGHSSPW